MTDSQAHLNLECPSCGKNGVAIWPQDGGRGTNNLTSYSAKCGTGTGRRGNWKGGCGYYVGSLGADGTQRSALREWKQILNNAAEARRILGVTLMEQKELELDVEAFIGTTPWVDAGVLSPLVTGWYNTRIKMSEEERALRQPPKQRRWWDGDGEVWSYPVTVGVHSEGDCEVAKQIPSPRSPNSLEWQGLLKKVV